MAEAPTRTAGVIPSIRRWLRSDLRVMRWVLLALYVALVVTLFVLLLDLSSGWGFPLVLATLVLVAQSLFIFVGGTMQLCRPIRRRRLLVPVVIAALMLTILLAGTTLALAELFEVPPRWLNEDVFALAFWVVMLLHWIGWGVLLYARTRYLPRFRALSRIANVLLAGSLAELLATVPSHLIVSRRPGCLVGITTMLGIVAGLSVMTFTFGPMIVLLFLRPRYRRERDDATPYCTACGYDLRASKDRCPECGLPIPTVGGARLG